MKKLTKLDLQELSETMNVIPEDEQCYYLGMGSDGTYTSLTGDCYFAAIAKQNDGRIDDGEIRRLAFDYFSDLNNMGTDKRIAAMAALKEQDPNVPQNDVSAFYYDPALKSRLVNYYIDHMGVHVDENIAWEDYRARIARGELPRDSELLWLQRASAIPMYPKGQNEGPHIVILKRSKDGKTFTLEDYSEYGHGATREYKATKLADATYEIWNANGRDRNEGSGNISGNDSSGFSDGNSSRSGSNSGSGSSSSDGPDPDPGYGSSQSGDNYFGYYY